MKSGQMNKKANIYFGVDARQIHESGILPEFCYTGRGTDGDTLMVNYSELTAVLINGMKEQQALIVELQNAVKALSSNIEFTPIVKKDMNLTTYFTSNV